VSFTDGKPWTVTADDLLPGKWGSGKKGNGLRCGLCGEAPKEGDSIRWVYANGYPADRPELGAPGGNFFVCAPCNPEQDNKAALAKRRELHAQLNKLHRCFTWSDHCPRPEDYR
jgi:hypothetical protein